MEGFSYVDIFDTKGVEYLIVIGFLLLIIPVSVIFSKPVQERINLSRSIQGLSMKLLNIPRGLMYAKNHTWTFMEKSGSAKVGVDDLLLHLTGGVSVDFLRAEGDRIEKGETLARIVQGDRLLQLKSPISGKIKKLNTQLQKQEGMINGDPYGKGWISQIEPEKWSDEARSFMLAEEAEKWVQEELERCKDFLATASASESDAHVHTVLQEGGELADFPLSEQPASVWNKFQIAFLD